MSVVCATETSTIAVTVTARARNILESIGATELQFVDRHKSGDWGDLSEEEKEQNRIAIKKGGPLVSTFDLRGNGVLWIVTDKQRSTIVVFTPSESWRYAGLVMG